MRCLIPKLRENRGWTQSELARLSGLSRQLIHNLEVNGTAPSIQTAFRLARTFDCKVEDLFENEEEPPESIRSNVWTPSYPLPRV